MPMQTQYSLIKEAVDTGDDTTESFSATEYDRPRRAAWILNGQNVWMFLTLLFSLTTLALSVALLDAVEPRHHHGTLGSYEAGFTNDLDAVKPTLELEVLSFTGALGVHTNGTVYRVVEGRQYVGRPNKEIERAWKELLDAQNVELTEDGGPDIADQTQMDENGKWIVGLEVHHQLHCLNWLRRHLDFDYYFTQKNRTPPYFYMDHLDHCVDSIRQSLQCHSDVTVNRYDYNELLDMEYPLFNQPHTCRNFRKIDEWAKQRSVRLFALSKAARPLDPTHV